MRKKAKRRHDRSVAATKTARSPVSAATSTPWRVVVEASQLIGLAIAAAALVVSLSSITLASEANSIATDSAERSRLTQQFESASSSLHGVVHDVVAYWTVISNDGRTPVTVLETHILLDLDDGSCDRAGSFFIEAKTRYLRLNGPFSDAIESGTLVLAAGEAAAVEVYFENGEGQLKNVHDACGPIRVALTHDLEVTLSNGTVISLPASHPLVETPTSVSDAYLCLGYGFWPMTDESPHRYPLEMPVPSSEHCARDSVDEPTATPTAYAPDPAGLFDPV
ncbi:hypothetical protein [Herbiconiux daphne]|uniref:DUF4352 domain-containing protein n=1 Tax=Herbiconiux daphne TaxID=2970914 RepID=A0ABT2H5Y3_9MICO|nr:hypothetical protein [Herbiconiux daphne]MCS5735346.1 hypothetical protein [Herbiconiux daphne]